MSPGLALAGLVVGFVVGLTGMGGGALLTPLLVLGFGVPPLAAVSNDIVVSALMKPFGGFVHLRRGTVNLQLVRWLCVGSVPASLLGVLVVRNLADGFPEQILLSLLGVALVLASTGMGVKAYLTLVKRARRRAQGLPADDTGSLLDLVVRPLPTIAVGIVGGFVVGMTSVGSGSVIVVALLALYPAINASQLVGTDLVQAVPLVAAAAAGHLLVGDFELTVAAPLLLGAIPGVILGARTSAVAPGGFLRRAIAVVLMASGLKLLGLPNGWLAVAIIALIVGGPLLWALTRRRQGLPAFARMERNAL